MVNHVFLEAPSHYLWLRIHSKPADIINVLNVVRLSQLLMTLYRLNEVIKMSCQMCRHYQGLKLSCKQGHYVYDAHLSIACDNYEYNQELKADES